MAMFGQNWESITELGKSLPCWKIYNGIPVSTEELPF